MQTKIDKKVEYPGIIIRSEAALEQSLAWHASELTCYVGKITKLWSQSNVRSDWR